jgi:hypothetical protein
MLALWIGATCHGDPENPHGFGPEFAGKINADPALTRTAVLLAITMKAACQLRMEHKVGSIDGGQYTHLIDLDQNFMQVTEHQLARNQGGCRNKSKSTGYGPWHRCTFSARRPSSARYSSVCTTRWGSC